MSDPLGMAQSAADLRAKISSLDIQAKALETWVSRLTTLNNEQAAGKILTAVQFGSNKGMEFNNVLVTQETRHQMMIIEEALAEICRFNIDRIIERIEVLKKDL